MAVFTKTLARNSTTGTDIFDITEDVQLAVADSGMSAGVATVFVPGSTGALTTVEYEPGLVHDITAFFERIIPRDMEYGHEQMWHDGNGHSHVRASLLGPSLAIPFLKGSLTLGTWQQVILVDFDNKPRERRFIVQITG
jgi:secondary thiamine-phosphate synthase enzyme